MNKPKDVAASWLLGPRFPRIAIWAVVALALATSAAYDLMQALLLEWGLPNLWAKLLILVLFSLLLYLLYLRFLAMTRSFVKHPEPVEDKVYLLNFAHPITEPQLVQVQQLLILKKPPEVMVVSAQVSRSRPLAEVAQELVDKVNLSTEKWQTAALVINPPGLAPLAAAVMAEIHGRRGHFPPILNLREKTTLNEQGEEVPVTPREFVVGEVTDLQSIRDQARTRR